MKLRERQGDDVSVIEVSGDLTVTDDPGALKELVATLIRRGERRIVLLVADLGRMDSTCLGEVVASYTTALCNDAVLVLAGVGPQLRRLLEITKLAATFELYDTEEQAVAALCARTRIDRQIST